MNTLYIYLGAMSEGLSHTAVPAPDVVNVHDLIASHLNNVKCTDKEVEVVVSKHVSNARAHHA